MKKISLLTLFLSLLTSAPVIARTIRFKEKTNDGSTLMIYTNYEPVRQSGWTVFKYGIRKGNTYRENIGVTPYCSIGKIKRDETVAFLQLPIPGWATPEEVRHIREISHTENLSETIKVEGWLVDAGPTINVIAADSPGSKAVLESVCSLVK
ncbi:MAG: hypothetical protein PUP93_30615 [Rhizonema sp. NSF051]|nr:hypothetical protein [Rhizonema sp. NSF051]